MDVDTRAEEAGLLCGLAGGVGVVGVICLDEECEVGFVGEGDGE